MKGLILFGSPHLTGKTNKVLTEVINSSEITIDFTRIDLLKKDIHHCIGCNQCNTGDFSCIYNDDMIEIYKAIEASDVIILATPIYFNSVTSIMKTMIDRCQRFFNMKVNHGFNFKKKKGILLGTAGSKLPKSFDSFSNVSDYFFLSVNGKIEKTLFVNGTDQEDYFNRHLEAIEEMKKFLYTITKD
jgi:multimeric flavodoxin WrbA